MFKVNFWNHIDKYYHSKTKVLHKVQKFLQKSNKNIFFILDIVYV